MSQASPDASASTTKLSPEDLERQIKLAHQVMDEDKGILRALADVDESASASTSSLPFQSATQMADTPINRATVCMLSTQELERELDIIRERRLALRLKVEALAKIKGDKADLTAFLKFEKLLKVTQAALAGLEARASKIEQEVNRLRALVIEMGE